MNRVKIRCDFCGKEVLRYPSRIKNHNFCSRECLAAFSNKAKNPVGYRFLKDYSRQSENMTRINQKLNPNRMTDETRRKLRIAHVGNGTGKTYSKLYSKAEHRVIAEKILGRKLNSHEVVHHLDFNPRNNDPDNLMIFPSQSEHAKYHSKLNRFFEYGIIDDRKVKEVMPL